MSDPIQLAIAKLQAKLREQERAASKTKMAINALCEAVDLPPMYAEDAEENHDVASLSIRSDQFYGQPLAAAIRTILEMRRKQDRGPATVNEIYAALIEGGFAFDTRNEENAKRGLRISLTKNSVTFHKLPNGKYGLLDWYPAAKTKRPRNGSTSGAADDDGGNDNADFDLSTSDEGNENFFATADDSGPEDAR
ncbi:hypothetical protein [Pelomonas sp. SE-A7]|uniref:hypothetical protein n=1 Tax=Pelomonas sp. SE-A7 TaxID=3054953 RepID=UPI00259C991A|nr:hypothetical protein [Pelomonas sp. SE-A7]MDM4767275.1 hypothetical protein [Pelomonas sp. SE-A7]